METERAILSSELLGFQPDARVLIVNADDFGMYPSLNMAVVRSREAVSREGIVLVDYGVIRDAWSSQPAEGFSDSLFTDQAQVRARP